MFGIETYELLSFFRQLGLALSGAGAFWGIVFFIMARRRGVNSPSSVLLAWLATRLRLLVFGGGFLAFAAWVIITLGIPVFAHEGITLISSQSDLLSAAHTMTPIYIALATVTVLMIIFRHTLTRFASRALPWVYGAVFVLVSIAISYYTDLRGLPAGDAIFHMFHGFHSIFTLGTVLTLDFLFISSQSSTILQQHVFPLFPKISKVIWVGLSMDLFSVFLIFPSAVILSPRFFFAQTVIGILIINGVLLSGVITRRVLRLLNEGKTEHSQRWVLFANIAGVISVTSWLSITFVDFFPNITPTYVHLIVLYLGIIVVLFSLHELWDRVIEPRLEHSFLYRLRGNVINK